MFSTSLKYEVNQQHLKIDFPLDIFELVTLSTMNSDGRFHECSFKDEGMLILPSGSSNNLWTQWETQYAGLSMQEKNNSKCGILYPVWWWWINKIYFPAPHLDSCPVFHLWLFYYGLYPTSPRWPLLHSTRARQVASTSPAPPGPRRHCLPAMLLLWNHIT